ncbi:helix-turn-helix domain-containing protein [Thermobifida alba]|uniref:Helix-turn-helix domain-containing protein n=1 Tax=Thermobifida alba TaxID=53522 RepID=A0ABY4KX99_THEAE|nr:helix-turn-helix domain-containing protein [Thermobifida alba]
MDAVRTTREQGISVKEVARQFGVHRSTVWARTRPSFS